ADTARGAGAVRAVVPSAQRRDHRCTRVPPATDGVLRRAAAHPNRRVVSARSAALYPSGRSERSRTMNSLQGEPTLEEMLSDPIIRTVMEADGIDPQELAATLRQTGRMLARRARREGPQSMPV